MNEPLPKKRKLPGGIKFLIVVVIIYILLAFVNKYLIIGALINSLILFAKISPILCLVIFIMFATNYFLKPKTIQKHLGRDSGIRGWVYAVIGGILISGPPYVLYPLLGDLKKAGMKNSLLGTLLYNRNVKIQFLPVMAYYFGTAFTVVISCYIILFSIFNGMLLDRIKEE